MEKKLKSPILHGKIKAISSKSMAHRLLICAAFADKESEIVCDDTNADICATVNCLNALGANVERTGNLYAVKPIKKTLKNIQLDCGESGSTLRFLLPIVSAVGSIASIYMHGRLSQRPLSPLFEQLEENGASLSPQGSDPLITSGILRSGDYRIAANISSQFISGLMFALPLINRFSDAKKDVEVSTLTLTGRIESAPYVDMTLDALSEFGVNFTSDAADSEKDEIRKYVIPSNSTFKTPSQLTVEGDWSNAAFWLAAGAIGKESLTVTSLNTASHQGDMAILDVLESFGAKIERTGSEITVFPSKLHGINLDASQIPDLVPILAVVAAVSEGDTQIYGAARLRIKESDRIMAVTNMLSTLGAEIKETDDGVIIHGQKVLAGGNVSSENDHRIAMAAAIASTVCLDEVVIRDAQAVEKSYPNFWNDFERLSK